MEEVSISFHIFRWGRNRILCLPFFFVKPPFLWGCRNLISINLASPLPPFPGFLYILEAYMVPGIGRGHLVLGIIHHPCWPPPRCPPCHLVFGYWFPRWLLTHLIPDHETQPSPLSPPSSISSANINSFCHTIPRCRNLQEAVQNHSPFFFCHFYKFNTTSGPENSIMRWDCVAS